MTRIFRTLTLLSSAAVWIATAPAQLGAQNFDNSGTAGLSGQYLFRYVTYFNDTSGNLQESCSLSGSMTFDGKGSYTVSNTQIYDSAGTSAGSCASLGGGTYGVQANGLAQFDNPLFSATLYGSYSAPVITASSTEDDYYDLFVAVQAPTASLSNSSLNGAYTVASLDFPNVASSSSSLAHQAYFTLNANGSGSVSTVTLTGSAANLSATNVTQTVSGVTYSLSGTTGGTLTFPNSVNNQLVGSGSKTLYVSSDGNYIIGGSTSGTDMIFGFRSATSPSNSLLNGTYFIGGLDANTSSGFLDAFYGSINANGAGTLLWHERFDDVVDQITYDSTFSSAVTIGNTGSYYDNTYTTLVGFNGQAGVLIGSGQQFSLNILVHAPSYTPTSGIWINPIGITNAANYTPITNAYAPGELVNIYGNFGGVSTQVDSAIPITTNLGGVQVLINGTAAPVYLVSANQISALVPYAVANDYFATFQVVVNGSQSNSVTVYADESAPGIYTLTQNGLGTSALLHSNYTTVTDASPAKPGETVSLYLNGLGTVTPVVADGAAGPASPLSYSTEYNAGNLSIVLDDFVDNYATANVTFAGLAPGFPGLYQVNFQVPSTGLGNGHVYIVVNTYEGQTEMSTISLSGFGHASGVSLVPARHAEAAIRAKQAVSRSKATVKTRKAALALKKDPRRALPDRVVER